MKRFIFTALLISAYCHLWSQTKVDTEKVNLNKIIFHSSRCYGNCPKIDFQIDSNKNILVNREYFKGTSKKDKSKSGHFKGVLDSSTYDKLLQVLKESDFKNLKFPDIDCCDGVITTIIIYSNTDRTYLKSMTPPKEASKLISFLNTIGTVTKLAKTDDKIIVEE